MRLVTSFVKDLLPDTVHIPEAINQVFLNPGLVRGGLDVERLTEEQVRPFEAAVRHAVRLDALRQSLQGVPSPIDEHLIGAYARLGNNLKGNEDTPPEEKLRPRPGWKKSYRLVTGILYLHELIDPANRPR